MDHALDTMGDAGSVSGKEARVKTPDAAGRRDRARNQEKPGRVGQEPGLGKRLPGAFEARCRAVALASEAKAGLLAGLADRGHRKRACARGGDFRAAFQEIFFQRLRDWRGDGNAIVRLVDTATGKDEFAGHEYHLVVAFADENLCSGCGSIDQDQRGGVDGTAIGMMVGFFLDFWCFWCFAHFASERPRHLLLFEGPFHGSGFCSSNPCMRSAHCTPTTAPLTGCSNNKDRTSVSGR